MPIKRFWAMENHSSLIARQEAWEAAVAVASFNNKEACQKYEQDLKRDLRGVYTIEEGVNWAGLAAMKQLAMTIGKVQKG